MTSPGARPEQLAATVAFGDLGPLVFGDHSLHLGEQLGLWVVVDRGCVSERDLHPVSGQFVEHDDLIGVDAGQPVRGQAPDPFDQSGFGGVAQAVQPRPVQPGTGMPVVAELGDQLVTLGGESLPQHRELGADGASLLLTLGRDPCVDSSFHRTSPSTIVSADRVESTPSRNANPAARASSRGSSCGLHRGRVPPSTGPLKTGSDAGQAISPASPRRAKRAADSDDDGASPAARASVRSVS